MEMRNNRSAMCRPPKNRGFCTGKQAGRRKRWCSFVLFEESTKLGGGLEVRWKLRAASVRKGEKKYTKNWRMSREKQAWGGSENLGGWKWKGKRKMTKLARAIWAWALGGHGKAQNQSARWRYDENYGRSSWENIVRKFTLKTVVVEKKLLHR